VTTKRRASVKSSVRFMACSFLGKYCCTKICLNYAFIIQKLRKKINGFNCVFTEKAEFFLKNP